MFKSGWPVFFSGLLFCSQLFAAQDYRTVEVPVITDFTRIAVDARERNLPILLMVSQEHCPYCTLLKEEILKPMLISGDYDDKVIIGEILIDVDDYLVDFSGKRVLASKISADYNTWVTPTLLFLDYRGREIHKRILGVNTIEMFGYYLDEALAAALKKVREQTVEKNTGVSSWF